MRLAVSGGFGCVSDSCGRGVVCPYVRIRDDLFTTDACVATMKSQLLIYGGGGNQETARIRDATVRI